MILQRPIRGLLRLANWTYLNWDTDLPSTRELMKWLPSSIMNCIRKKIFYSWQRIELPYELQKLKGRFEVQIGYREKGDRDLNENGLIQILWAKLKLGKKCVTLGFTTDIVRGVVRAQVLCFALITFSPSKYCFKTFDDIDV